MYILSLSLSHSLHHSRYGLVPNGGRQYYTRRSEPPLLTQMIELYHNRTGDTSILEITLALLDVEYEFWVQNRTIPSFGPAYSVPTDTPRYMKEHLCCV